MTNDVPRIDAWRVRGVEDGGVTVALCGNVVLIYTGPEIGNEELFTLAPGETAEFTRVQARSLAQLILARIDPDDIPPEEFPQQD